ncbi:tol-pal system protein YbgF [Geovibrio ferrireducens]|jgi:tol-pal system protein YbgF|uniref:tol-pal system protein YbgF n=1 Tax=Geovibrio ferrireducens TaxID=46201 RepID=UPI0022469EAE|nr:tol-pal system protein YbgF [Geovibrio ferrireducens]
MKKTMAVITLSFLAFACSDETQVIKQSINNIKDEMVSMQSEMAEMKISIEDVDRKTEANKGSINANSNALAEIRSELSFLGSEVTLLKDKQKAPAPAAAGMTEISEPGAQGEGNLIIIEDAFADKSSLYSYAYELYKNGKYPESQAKFNEFLAKYPADELSDNAVYWLGEIQYALKDYEGAIKLFHKLVTDYPDGNKVSDGLLKMAYSYGNIGKRAESVVTLKKIVNEHPGTRAYNLAKKKLASMGE